MSKPNCGSGVWQASGWMAEMLRKGRWCVLGRRSTNWWHGAAQYHRLIFYQWGRRSCRYTAYAASEGELGANLDDDAHEEQEIPSSRFISTGNVDWYVELFCLFHETNGCRWLALTMTLLVWNICKGSKLCSVVFCLVNAGVGMLLILRIQCCKQTHSTSS